jgi:hypothetical protein
MPLTIANMAQLGLGDSLALVLAIVHAIST